MDWQLPRRTIRFPRRPLIMGIVNINDDSFCRDGTLDPGEAAAQSIRQIEAGADIIDIGAESAGTNRGAVSTDEETRRLAGFLAHWPAIVATATPRDDAQVWPPVLSVNTWRPEVAAAILQDPQTELLNDMGGLPDDRNARACAATGASLLIMHTVGEPKVPHIHQRWDDIMDSLDRFFDEKIRLARQAGVPTAAIVIDPGINFAKQREDNLTIFRRLGKLARFGVPVLVPLSRKKVIGEVLGLADPRERDAGGIACIAAAMDQGAHILRVHNVDATWQAVKTLAAWDR